MRDNLTFKLIYYVASIVLKCISSRTSIPYWVYDHVSNTFHLTMVVRTGHDFSFNIICELLWHVECPRYTLYMPAWNCSKLLVCNAPLVLIWLIWNFCLKAPKYYMTCIKLDRNYVGAEISHLFEDLPSFQGICWNILNTTWLPVIWFGYF